MKTLEKGKEVPGLKKQMIGNIISSDLKETFRKYLSGDDKALISQQSKVGFHTVDKLLGGVNPLTENNCKALLPAVNIAINKTSEEIEEAMKARKKMKSLLK